MENTVLDDLINRYPQLLGIRKDILSAFEVLSESYKNGGKLIVCGNGGSASDADHIIGELMKSFTIKRQIPAAIKKQLSTEFGDMGITISEKLEGTLPAISLNCHSALISAYTNDVDADLIFAQQVLGYGNRSDILLGISTSGNAKNILNAMMVAKAMGIQTIGLTGRDGGQFNQLCDVLINVGGNITAQIQELHLPVYHTLCQMLEHSFFKLSNKK